MLAEQLGRSEYQLPLIHGEWNYHTVQGRHRLALSLAEQTAQMRNDVAARLFGHRLVGNTHLYLGELAAAGPVPSGAGASATQLFGLCMRTLQQTTNTVWCYCNSR